MSKDLDIIAIVILAGWGVITAGLCGMYNWPHVFVWSGSALCLLGVLYVLGKKMFS